jgi:hypothetical protein
VLILRISTDFPSSKDREYKNVDTDFINSQLSNGDSIIVLYGQELCGSCNSMKTKLLESTGKDMQLYYLASESVSDYAFLKTHEINMAPSLLVVNNHTLTVYEGDLSSEKIVEIVGGFS